MNGLFTCRAGCFGLSSESLCWKKSKTLYVFAMQLIFRSDEVDADSPGNYRHHVNQFPDAQRLRRKLDPNLAVLRQVFVQGIEHCSVVYEQSQMVQTGVFVAVKGYRCGRILRLPQRDHSVCVAQKDRRIVRCLADLIESGNALKKLPCLSQIRNREADMMHTALDALGLPWSRLSRRHLTTQNLG